MQYNSVHFVSNGKVTAINDEKITIKIDDETDFVCRINKLENRIEVPNIGDNVQFTTTAFFIGKQ